MHNIEIAIDFENEQLTFSQHHEVRGNSEFEEICAAVVCAGKFPNQPIIRDFGWFMDRTHIPGYSCYSVLRYYRIAGNEDLQDPCRAILGIIPFYCNGYSIVLTGNTFGMEHMTRFTLFRPKIFESITFGEFLLLLHIHGHLIYYYSFSQEDRGTYVSSDSIISWLCNDNKWIPYK